jgi:peptidoglycan/xylan/chitin deacetylase (PgdA/CDA1 family)
VALTGFDTVRVGSVACANAAWACGSDVSLPARVVDRLGWRPFIDDRRMLRIPVEATRPSADDAADLRQAAAFTDRPPASARLPFSYHAVPAWARAVAATAIGRWQRRRVAEWARFPAWPIDLSADFLADLAADPAPAAPLRKTPVVLSHDLDSPEGLSRLVSDFLPIEESLSARSTSYIVPCAWPIDFARTDDVVARGHALGVHGYDHSNRTAFADAPERRRRLDGAAALVDRYGIIGYRSPSLLRTRALLRDLAVRYRYDSSIPTSGGPFPVPNNGCATARPFTIEGVIELPVTMPRDGTLRFLGFSPAAIARLWIDCADAIARAGGVVVLLTHCERRFSGSRTMLRVYRSFLEYIAGNADRFAFSSAAGVVDAFAPLRTTL